MRDLFVWLVVITMTTFIITYVYKIYKHKITPTLSTWIIFFLGTTLSFITYLIAEKHDLSSGILNTIDIANVIIVITAIIIFGKHTIHFNSFEKWYLGGVGFIIFYGFVSGNAWSSNIFTQILLCIGYAPTFHILLKNKINTESFTAWGINLVVSILALYPAIVEGNLLASLYAIRATILISTLIIIMIYCEFYTKKRRKN
ncbi:MAG: hypothetical protein A3A89_04860 [Candidatus Magasanikbacteria bacterium RIFCSPLOWO2_01_FULL_33_34]|nr:MAG: hypothetical protein A3A89_04860 [Candidatus Magasanikbacteria bacterium RIFCSPLOWO2_01_FULL_33_34]